MFSTLFNGSAFSLLGLLGIRFERSWSFFVVPLELFLGESWPPWSPRWWIYGFGWSKTFKNNLFFHSDFNVDFLPQIGPRDEKSEFLDLRMVQHRSSGVTNRDQKSIRILGRKKRGSKVEKSELKNQIPTSR